MRRAVWRGEDGEVSQPERPLLEVKVRRDGWGTCSMRAACHAPALFLVLRHRWRGEDCWTVAQFACSTHLPADAREVQEAEA